MQPGQPMPPPDEMPPEQGEGGGVQKLVEGIHTDLMKFMELVQSAAPQVAAKLEAVVQGFAAVVEELVGGEKPPQAGPPNQPTDQGAGAVPM